MRFLSKTVVLIVGAVLFIGIAVLFYFVFIRPQLDTIASLKEETEKHKQYAERRPQVEKELADAKLETQRVLARMDVIYHDKMPNISLATPDYEQYHLMGLTGPGRDWFASRGFAPGAAAIGDMIFSYFNSVGVNLENSQEHPVVIPQLAFRAPISYDRSIRCYGPLPLNLRFKPKDFADYLRVFDKFQKAPFFLVIQRASLKREYDEETKTPYLQAEIPVFLYAWTKDYAAPAAAPTTTLPGTPMGLPGTPGAIATPTPSAPTPSTPSASAGGGEGEESTSLGRKMRSGE